MTTTAKGLTGLPDSVHLSMVGDSMRTAATALAMCLIVTMLAVPHAQASHSTVLVEGESATPVNPNCSPDYYNGARETTAPRAYSGSSAGMSMLMPHNGCQISFSSQQLRFGVTDASASVRFTLNGQNARMCGGLEFSGMYYGSVYTCEDPDTWISRTVSLAKGSGTTLVITATTSPSFVNVYFDFLEMSYGHGSYNPPAYQPSCPTTPTMCAPDPTGICILGSTAECIAAGPPDDVACLMAFLGVTVERDPLQSLKGGTIHVSCGAPVPITIYYQIHDPAVIDDKKAVHDLEEFLMYPYPLVWKLLEAALSNASELEQFAWQQVWDALNRDYEREIGALADDIERQIEQPIKPPGVDEAIELVVGEAVYVMEHAKEGFQL